MNENLFPTYTQFKESLNEANNGKKIAKILMKYADKAWKTLKIESGSDLYTDMDKQKKYIDNMKKSIELGGIADDIAENGEAIYDELEDENHHSLNAFLIFGDFMLPDVKDEYIKYHKMYPTSYLNPALFK